MAEGGREGYSAEAIEVIFAHEDNNDENLDDGSDLDIITNSENEVI